MDGKKPVYSPRIRSAWLKKRHWPFQVTTIYPTGSWRVSAGSFDTFGEGATFEEAIDDAITNEKRRKTGCCRVDVAVITEVPATTSRQMLRAIDKMREVLTGGRYNRRCA